MSIRLMSAVWDAETDLSRSRLLMLLAMADFANDAGEQCWPSMATLAKKTRVKEHEASMLVSLLQEGGYVEVVEPGGGRKSNHYRIHPLGDGPKKPPRPKRQRKPKNAVQDTPYENVPPTETHPQPLRKHTPSPYENIGGSINEPPVNHPSSFHSEPAASAAGVTVPEPKPAKVQPVRKAQDPRISHAAIRCVQGIQETTHLPPKALWDVIIQTLGPMPDGSRLAACWRAWNEYGYRPSSWKWLTEWYPQGGPPKRNGNGGNGKPSRAVHVERSEKDWDTILARRTAIALQDVNVKDDHD